MRNDCTASNEYKDNPLTIEDIKKILGYFQHDAHVRTYYLYHYLKKCYYEQKNNNYVPLNLKDFKNEQHDK